MSYKVYGGLMFGLAIGGHVALSRSSEVDTAGHAARSGIAGLTLAGTMLVAGGDVRGHRGGSRPRGGWRASPTASARTSTSARKERPT